MIRFKGYSWLLYRCLLIAGVLMIFINATAQVREAREPALKKLLQGKNTVAEVMPVVEAFYLKNGGTTLDMAKGEFENEYVHWKRWEYNTLQSEGPHGKKFNANAEKMKIYQEQKALENTSEYFSTPNWTFVGPSSSSYVTTPPGGLNGLGRCDRIAFHPTNPNIIYVGAPMGGLWRTLNNGASWTCLTSFLPVPGVSGIVISHADPNTIYILTGNGDDQKGTATVPGIYSSAGVFKSTDGGINWQLLPIPWGTDTVGVAPYKIVQSPRFANKLLVASSRGLYYSSSSGNYWAKISSLPCYDVDFVPGKDTVWCAVQQSMGLVVYRSEDGGNSWSNVSFGPAANTPIPNPPSRMSLAVTNVNYGGIELAYLFCGPVTGNGTFSGLYRTNIGGYLQLVRTTPNLFSINAAGGDATGQPNYDNCITVNPINANMIFTGGCAIYKSADAGFSISISAYYGEDQAGFDLTKYVHGDIHDLAYNPLNNYVYAASDGGLYYSTDNGLNWNNISAGINCSMFYDIDGLENNQHALLGGLQDNGNKYRNTNTPNFMHLGAFDGFFSALSPSNASLGYFSSNWFLLKHSNLGDGVYTGINPVSSSTPGQWAWRMETDNLDGNYLYTSTQGIDSIWISNNAGSSWFRRRAANGNRAIVTCPSNNNRVYVCGSTPISNDSVATLKRSENKGDTWTADMLSNPGLPAHIDIGPNDVEVSPLTSNTVFIVYSGFNAGEKVYTSTNAGATWGNISSNLPNLNYTTIAVDYSNNLYLGSDYGVFFKLAGSSQWQYYSNNLPRVRITDLEINITNGFLYAATYGRGIWRADLYGACDNFIFFSGNQTGEKQYEAEVIWSTAKLDQLQGTKIMYKTSDSTKLLLGFHATDGVIEFRSTSAPCGSGFPWLKNVTDSSLFDLSKISYPSNTNDQFPFATLNVQKNGYGVELIINNKQEGNIKIKLTDEQGKVLQEVYAENKLDAGVKNWIAKTGDLKPGLYYFHLIHNDVLVHSQEYFVE